MSNPRSGVAARARRARFRVTDADGKVLSRRDLRTVPGPGASQDTLRRFRPREH